MVKKILAVATAILMLCCMVPLAAFADDVLDLTADVVSWIDSHDDQVEEEKK